MSQVANETVAPLLPPSAPLRERGSERERARSDRSPGSRAVLDVATRALQGLRAADVDMAAAASGASPLQDPNDVRECDVGRAPLSARLVRRGWCVLNAEALNRALVMRRAAPRETVGARAEKRSSFPIRSLRRTTPGTAMRRLISSCCAWSAQRSTRRKRARERTPEASASTASDGAA